MYSNSKDAKLNNERYYFYLFILQEFLVNMDTHQKDLHITATVMTVHRKQV